MATAQLRATIDDLYKVEGRAELIAGRIVELALDGPLPNLVAGNIACSLKQYQRQSGRGRSTIGCVGYTVPMLSSGRESFCPDVAYFDAPPLANPMAFVPFVPALAVEVRNDADFDRGDNGEQTIAMKRADYSEACTKVVWDVDPVNETITRYTSPTDPGTVFRRGDVADAEAGVPGWRVAVDEVFSN